MSRRHPHHMSPSHKRPLPTPDLWLVVDLEATCDRRGFPRDQMETIEVGAVLVDARTHAAVAEFQTFVRPVVRPWLTPFCTELTSITQADVDSAPVFAHAMATWAAWLDQHARGRSFVFASWGRYDRNQLEQDARRARCPLPTGPAHVDLKTAFAAARQVKRCGMVRALSMVGIPLEGTHHRGIDDARNIAKLLPHIVPHPPCGRAEPSRFCTPPGAPAPGEDVANVRPSSARCGRPPRWAGALGVARHVQPRGPSHPLESTMRTALASFFVLLSACGDKETDPPAITDVQVEDDQLVVTLAAGVYGWRCDPDRLRVHRADAAGALEVLHTDADLLGDIWTGYWLDGTFRYPTFDEGCDVMQCVPLDTLAVGRTAYTLVGTGAPPDDLQAHHDTYGWGETAPTTVNILESERYAGELEVEIRVHRAADCRDPERTDRMALTLE